MRFVDGSLAATPIALCEVQGYVYAALDRAVALRDRSRRPRARDVADRRAPTSSSAGSTRTSGSRPTTAATSRWARPRQAAHRRHRFEHGSLPLDGHRRRGEGAARRARAAVAEACSAAGASARCRQTNAGYNPISYHCGSVWPHDNAICAAGLMRYGFVDEAHRVMRGHRRRVAVVRRPAAGTVLGHRPRTLTFPVSYPTSCSPQAWAAASPLALPAHAVAVRARHPQRQAPPRAGRSRLDRHPAPRQHPDHGRTVGSRGRRARSSACSKFPRG